MQECKEMRLVFYYSEFKPRFKMYEIEVILDYCILEYYYSYLNNI